MPGSTRFRADALELELFRHALGSIVDEAEVNLTRTAYSPLIHEYRDYCVGLLSRDFGLLAQARGSIPIFIADLGEPVRDAVEVIGIDNLADGDAFITNYVPVCGQHINNVITAQPLFHNGEIRGYVAVRAHWADLGGLAIGSVSWNAREIFQEGTQFRGLRVMRDGRRVPEAWATIAANTRLPEFVIGDLAAQVAACHMAALRWKDRLDARWSAEELDLLTTTMWRTSEERARDQIGNLPDGRYSAACRMDDGGLPGSKPLELAVAVRIHGSDIEIDWSALPMQVRAPINIGLLGGAVSASRVAYKALFLANEPTDEGLFKPLTVITRSESLLSAGPYAPRGHWNATVPTAIDLVVKAIGQSIPELTPAGHHGTMAGVMIAGRRDDDSHWQYIDSAIGGWGGNREKDGFSPLKTFMHGDNKDIPIEVMERQYPLRMLNYRFAPDTAGAGKHRGGFGTEKTYEALGPMELQTSMDRTIDPPWGLAGGGPGVPGDIRVRRNGKWKSMKKAVGQSLNAGARIYVRTSGGGGWGNQQERAEDDVKRDHEAGLVKGERAHRVLRQPTTLSDLR